MHSGENHVDSFEDAGFAAPSQHGRSVRRRAPAPSPSRERVSDGVGSGVVLARELDLVAVHRHIHPHHVEAARHLRGAHHHRRLGRGAAGVAHEINNPIAIIRGYLKTMRQEAQTPELLEELVILDEEATACQRIAEDLLTYAHSPAMEPRTVQVSELLQDAVERSEGASSSRQRPDAAPAVVLSVDPLRIRQIVVNLVKNAREASLGEEAVEVRGRCHGTDYRIEVLDRGKGLSAEVRERLFEPFFTTRRDGTGLGLAVCYGLVSSRARLRSG